MSHSDATHVDSELPPVDARLAIPETRYEIDDGVLVYVSPADEALGALHSKISALLEAHVAADFDVAIDMLTRTSKTSDIAPDVSVFPYARDPATGGRQLEQLAFEVVSTGSLSRAGRKAAKLVARGVRRVFAIDVKEARALEWSGSLGTWSLLGADAYLEDPVLEARLAIEAVVHAAKADDAVARALLIKRNPVIEAVRAQDRVESKQQGFIEGKQQGLIEGAQQRLTHSVISVLEARGIAPSTAERARILGEQDLEVLARWLTRSATCSGVAALFA